MILELTLRITSIRSQDPFGFGGCIFSGKIIDIDGYITNAAAYYVIKASSKTLGHSTVQVGDWWNVTGEAMERSLNVNGFTVTEWQIDASKAFLSHPSGEYIVAFIANNPAFEGVGMVKARRLWDTLGEKLYHALDAGDVDTLALVLTPECAVLAVGAWTRYGDSKSLQWLQSQGIDLKIGQRLLHFFGRETPNKLQEDPYRLLSFCASWRAVDALATSHFGIELDDPRRLQGAIEEACYRVFATGHTVVLPSTLMDYLRAVLGDQTSLFPWHSLIAKSLAQGLANGSFIVSHLGLQPLGALFMEEKVAEAVNTRLSRIGPTLMSKPEVDQLLLAFESSDCIELNAEQRMAVQLATEESFMLITGGAGVGKTTVLKALYKVYDYAGLEVVQLALAGRAAKRMQETTSRNSSTIASFLRSNKMLAGRYVVVVDEASMIDIVTMYRLVVSLGSEVRIVMAGDPEQLMPIGPGLVLHALMRVPNFPQIELKIVKRHGGAIAAAAASIRTGIWPNLPDDETAAIAFLPCLDAHTSMGTSLIAETVLDLYRLDPTNTQVLCARRMGSGGVKSINKLLQSAMTSHKKPLLVWSIQHNQMILTGFNLDDPVLCTRNMWEQGLQNGSLGTIIEIADSNQQQSVEDCTETEPVLAWVLWDDQVRRPITESMLDDLELGYAITVHKAQGSQWKRVIVIATQSRLFDRTLIYTAITRAQMQVLIVEDQVSAKLAVEREPRVRNRNVTLDQLIRSTGGTRQPR